MEERGFSNLLPDISRRVVLTTNQFERKSVEGLSILLFVFAFAGNLTYVLSILFDPSGDGNPNGASHYLLEALPYLLGSGGTLLFDLTIMFQSILYGSAPPVPLTPGVLQGRKRLFRRRLLHLEDGRTISVSVSSERQPLLSGSISRDRTRSRSPDVTIRGTRGQSVNRSRGVSVVAEAAVG
jgi:hypothetical protein